MRIIRAYCCIIVATSALLGCDQHSSRALFHDYHYRMGNVLDLPLADASKVKLQSYPSLRSLRQTLTQGSINLLEFWKLRTCKLQTLLGEKNNALGKVMPTSQEWIYAAKFLALAPMCVSQLRVVDENDTLPESTLELIDALSSAIAVKQSEKYRYAWNATLASPEFAHVFSLASEPVPTDFVGAANLRQAWETLLEALHQYDTEDAVPTHIEDILKIVASSRYIGALLQSARLIEATLLPITQTINEKSRSCGFNAREKTAVKNVFSKYYVGKIQPYLASVHREMNDYQPLLHRLLQYFRDHQQHIDPNALALIEDYYQANWGLLTAMNEYPVSQLTRLKTVVLNHARAWQTLSKNCGLPLIPMESAPQ